MRFIFVVPFLLVSGNIFATDLGESVFFSHSLGFNARIQRKGNLHRTPISAPVRASFNAAILHGQYKGSAKDFQKLVFELRFPELIGVEGGTLGILPSKVIAPNEDYGAFWLRYDLPRDIVRRNPRKLQMLIKSVEYVAGATVEVFDFETFMADDIEYPSGKGLSRAGTKKITFQPKKGIRIYSRESWGAREIWKKKRVRDNWDTSMPAVMFVHHTVTPRPTQQRDSMYWLRSMDRGHLLRGFTGGFGYQYAIDFDGNIFEGRPVSVMGAHARELNFGSIGIAFMGNFHDKHKPTKAMISSFRELEKWLIKKYMIKEMDNYGHRNLDTGKPVCPGGAAFAWTIPSGNHFKKPETFRPVMLKRLQAAKEKAINFDGSSKSK